MPGQYHPLPGEFVATGVMGIFIYSLIIYFAIQSVRLGIKSKSTKRFFLSVILLALFEIPRFSAMAIEADYNSKGAYCFHVLGGVFFFAAFSIVCRQWSGLLQLGSYFRAVYGRQGLILANVLFGIVDIIAVVACVSASDLSAFFKSPGFAVITLIEGVRNCVYSVFLAYYGVKLVRRFWHFSRIERQASSNQSILAYLNWTQTSNAENAVFTKVVLRMTSVLVLSSVCFIMRVCMLIAKMAAVHTHDPITTPDFALFGFLWFCCSDFIPRSLPTLAFIFLMRTRRPPAKEMRQSTSHKADGHDEFQFVRLADDDSFFNLSDFDNRTSFSSVTEVMLNNDKLATDSKRSLHPGDAMGNSKIVQQGPGRKTPEFHHPESGLGGHHQDQGHGHGHGQGGQNHLQLLPGGGHTLLSTYDAGQDEEDANDDDFYSLDDEDWNNGEPSLIDKFFSAITFSATHKAVDHAHAGSAGSAGGGPPGKNLDAKARNSKDLSYDSSDMRL